MLRNFSLRFYALASAKQGLLCMSRPCVRPAAPGLAADVREKWPAMQILAEVERLGAKLQESLGTLL